MPKQRSEFPQNQTELTYLDPNNWSYKNCTHTKKTSPLHLLESTVKYILAKTVERFCQTKMLDATPNES